MPSGYLEIIARNSEPNVDDCGDRRILTPAPNSQKPGLGTDRGTLAGTGVAINKPAHLRIGKDIPRESGLPDHAGEYNIEVVEAQRRPNLRIASQDRPQRPAPCALRAQVWVGAKQDQRSRRIARGVRIGKSDDLAVRVALRTFREIWGAKGSSPGPLYGHAGYGRELEREMWTDSPGYVAVVLIAN